MKRNLLMLILCVSAVSELTFAGRFGYNAGSIFNERVAAVSDGHGNASFVTPRRYGAVDAAGNAVYVGPRGSAQRTSSGSYAVGRRGGFAGRGPTGNRLLVVPGQGVIACSGDRSQPCNYQTVSGASGQIAQRP